MTYATTPLPIEDTVSALLRFIAENYYPIFCDVGFGGSDRSVLDLISKASFENILELISHSDIFVDSCSCFIFPLSTVRVEEPVSLPSFCISPLGSFPEYLLPKPRPSIGINSNAFPQFNELAIRPQFPTSCLFLAASHVGIAEKTKSMVLAALSLGATAGQRYTFSGRTVATGIAEISQKLTYYGRGEHTPPLMNDIEVGGQAIELLQGVHGILMLNDPSSLKKMNSLEYYYKAWFQTVDTRFPLLFSTLDALFGDPNRATQAVISGVIRMRPKEFDETRLKLLLSLRGSNVHGGSPNVHESAKYSKYIENYGVNPIQELEDIVGMVLTQSLLGDSPNS